MGSPFIGDGDLSTGDEAVQAALNQFGIDPSLITDAVTVDRVPRTRTRTSHGLTIRVGGKTIGAIFQLSHNQTRTTEDVWEIDANSHGAAPVDIIPQIVGQRTLSVGRYDLFTATMEQVMNQTGEIISLADQFRPFSLRTIWQSPVGIVLGGRHIYEFSGCWFTRMGRVVRSDDDRIVRADAELVYKSVRRVL